VTVYYQHFVVYIFLFKESRLFADTVFCAAWRSQEVFDIAASYKAIATTAAAAAAVAVAACVDITRDVAVRTHVTNTHTTHTALHTYVR